MKTQLVENLLRQAYGPDRGCPQPESYLRESLDRMSDAQRDEILGHAQQCPACAAEQELARSFDSVPDEKDDDVEFVVSRLRSPVTGLAPVAVLDRARSRKTQLWLASRTWLAAAAVVIVAGLGIVSTLRSPAPGLPPRGAETAMRSGRMEIRSPIGELEAIPRSLSWEAVDGAENYRVRVIRVDDSVLFEYIVGSTSVDLPHDVRDQLNPAVVYHWYVEAIDSADKQVAVSERVRFRVRPGAR